MNMIHDIKSAAERSQNTLLPDALGVVSLAVILVAALHIPHFV